MNSRTLAENLLTAHVLMKAANEHLKVVYEFKNKIEDKSLVKLIRDTKPTLSFFNKRIEQDMFSDPNFSQKHWEDIEERIYALMEDIDREIKKMK